MMVSHVTTTERIRSPVDDHRLGLAGLILPASSPCALACPNSSGRLGIGWVCIGRCEAGPI